MDRRINALLLLGPANRLLGIIAGVLLELKLDFSTDQRVERGTKPG